MSSSSDQTLESALTPLFLHTHIEYVGRSVSSSFHTHLELTTSHHLQGTFSAPGCHPLLPGWLPQSPNRSLCPFITILKTLARFVLTWSDVSLLYSKPPGDSPLNQRKSQNSFYGLKGCGGSCEVLPRSPPGCLITSLLEVLLAGGPQLSTSSGIALAKESHLI